MSTQEVIQVAIGAFIIGVWAGSLCWGAAAWVPWWGLAIYPTIGVAVIVYALRHG